LEIVAKDRLGLLSTIARTISQAGCNIEVALISTEGHKAIDNFYLTYQSGQLAGELQSHLCGMMKKSLDRLSASNPA
jgi:UTP:GlnB (protein PII) uridylyltransferase